MKAQINLITILTDNIDTMRGFYNQVLGFRIKNDLGGYVERSPTCQYAMESTDGAVCRP